MHCRKVFLLVVCLSTWVLSFAQQYPFVHYTPKDGLVNSRVRKAYQDSKGRMYFLTYGGLSMYDGARFKNYTQQNGLLSDLVNDVLELDDDSLLVAVNTNGINILSHGEMKKMNFTEGTCPLVNQFIKGNDGNIYATCDDGLYILKKTGFKKLPVVVPGQKEGLVYLGAIEEDRDFLVFTTNDLKYFTGLFLYNKKTGRLNSTIPGLRVSNLTKDRNGLIWINANGKIMSLDTVALLAGKLVLVNPYSSFVNANAISPGTVIFNNENEPLIFSAGKGITYYRKNGTTSHIDPPELNSFLVQNFFIDRENVIWICYDGNGVYKLSNTKLRSMTSSVESDRTGVRTVIAATPDSTWMVMKNRQWVLCLPSGNKKFHISPSFDATLLFTDKKFLYAADNQNLYQSALPESNETNVYFKKILTLAEPAFFTSHSTIDHYENSIFSESGNICAVVNGKKIVTYPFWPYDLTEGMHIDKANRLWIASRFNGLIIFSLHPNDTSGYFKKEFQFIKELETASPRCMVFDHEELLWVGTRSHGLMGFQYKNNQLKKIYHYQTHDGLTDNYITALACDKNNNIIIGTQTGLDRLVKTKNSYRIENLTKSNNIFSFITLVWVNSQDDAFALTNSGALFGVESIQNNAAGNEPRLLIEEMKVNGKKIPSVTSTLRLKYFQRNISFSIAAPTFIDEKEVKFSYLLSGSSNNQWSDTTSVAEISLPNLSPGNYLLRVKAFFPSTSYSEKEIQFSFSIRPPWWQTWWFRGLAGILIIALLIIVFRYYYRRKLEKHLSALEKQQAIEKERTRIATDMHDDLGAGLTRIKFIAENISEKTNDAALKPDIEKLKASSTDLVENMAEIIWAMNEKNNSLEDLIYYLRSYSVDYCTENRLACEFIIPENIPQKIIGGQVRRNVFLILKESLHNIIKHADAKKVTIDLRADEELFLSITDDGKGFEHTLHQSGNGLLSMEQRAKALKGKLWVSHLAGTSISLEVPV